MSQSLVNVRGWVWLLLLLVDRCSVHVQSFVSLPSFSPGSGWRALKASKSDTGSAQRFNKGDGSLLNTQIISIFKENGTTIDDEDHSIMLEKLKFLVYDRQDRINHVHVVSFMQRAAKLKIRILDVFPAEFLLERLNKTSGAITQQGSSATSPPHMEWKAMEIAQALYGMRYMCLSHKGVTEIVVLMIDQVKHCRGVFSGQEIANCFYGLQSLPDDHHPTSAHNALLGKLLKALTKKLRESLSSSKTFMGSQELSNLLYGLRGMDSTSHPAILDVFDIVSQHIEKRGEMIHFSSQGIASSLNALQGCGSDKKAVVGLLRALLPHVQKANDMIDVSIGSSVMGLSRMSDCLEVREVLSILAKKLEERPGMTMRQSPITSSFNGLRNLNDTIPEVRRFVAALNTRLQQGLAREKFSSVSIGNIMYGLRRMTTEYGETRYTLALLVQAIEATPIISPLDLGKCVHGLQSISKINLESMELRAMLSLLARRWESLEKDEPTSRDVSQAIFGLKGLSHNTEIPEVQHLLGVLSRRLKALTVKQPLNPQCVSMSLLGLQKCTSSEGSKPVKEILLALSREGAIQTMDSQAIANCLYSMTRMTSDDVEVKAFLRVLTNQLKMARSTPLHFTDQELANSFYGLQGMNSMHPEVLDLLQELTRHLSETRHPFTSQGLGNALTGFQSMSSQDSSIVVNALGVFADKIDLMTNVEMTPNDFANAVFGLQGCTSESEEVRAVLLALTEKMRRITTATFSSRDISFCLTGLAGMQQSMGIPEVMEMLEELNLKVSTSPLRGIPKLEFKTFGKGSRVKAM